MTHIDAPHSRSTRRTRALTAAALIAGLSLTACSDDEPESEPAATVSEEAQETEEAPATDSLNHEDHDHDAGEYHDELTADDQAEVTARAEDFVEAAAQHDDEQQWWDEVEPFLTDTGIPNFNTVDPRTIEYTERDDDAEIHEAQTANLVHVDVPTNGPTMRVLLTRGGSPEWLVERWEYADSGTEDD